MNTVLKSAVAAAALAASAMLASPEASAKDLKFSLTIGGPNGYIHVGDLPPPRAYEPVRRYDHGYRDGYGHGRRDYGYGCLPPRVVKHRLHRDGWYDLELLRRREDIAVVAASAHNGLRYRLKVDACTGVVLAARLMDGYGGGRRHWR